MKAGQHLIKTNQFLSGTCRPQLKTDQSIIFFLRIALKIAADFWAKGSSAYGGISAFRGNERDHKGRGYSDFPVKTSLLNNFITLQ